MSLSFPLPIYLYEKSKPSFKMLITRNLLPVFTSHKKFYWVEKGKFTVRSSLVRRSLNHHVIHRRDRIRLEFHINLSISRLRSVGVQNRYQGKGRKNERTDNFLHEIHRAPTLGVYGCQLSTPKRRWELVPLKSLPISSGES